MSYHHLSSQERFAIFQFLSAGWSLCAIARQLGRAPSTISREVRRNQKHPQPRYWPELAEYLAQKRRHKAPRPSKQDDARLYRVVVRALRNGFSPQIIAQRLCSDFPRSTTMRISHETIYRWVYTDARAGGQLYRCLVRSHKTRRRQRHKPWLQAKFPGRVGIAQRPAIVDKRARLGDWESDTVMGRKGKAAVVTHVDRKSRFLLAAKLADMRAATLAAQTRRVFRVIPAAKRKTLTCDNGTEFASFRRIERDLGVSVYFADPYSAWQRGTNENTNGLLRRYFPKGTDFSDVHPRTLATVVHKLNNRPRKCLGYKTPFEVFFNIKTIALQG
jgi:IS30 family transposase